MISIFPLWTFHSYVATFQLHLHMEYISLSSYEIPELVIPIRISLIEGCCLQGSYWTKGSSCKVEVITSKILRSPPWLGWPLWNICASNDHGYVPLVVKTSWSFPHSRLITGFVTRLTRWVPVVEQEMLTFPEHMSSPPVFSGVRVTRSLTLYVCFVDCCLSCCTFSFGHCVVCSSIYGFWLPLWYLQTLLPSNTPSGHNSRTILTTFISIW